MPVDVERAKAVAAQRATEEVRPGMRVALGTGTTAAYAVRALAERFPRAAIDCVASSRATEALAASVGLSVRPLRGDDRFDLMIDGADEVSPSLDLTKGGGGALLREKLLARLSQKLVIVVDPSKLVRYLGERVPIPIEVVPFARPVVAHLLEERGYRPRLREGAAGEPYRTDNANEILDVRPSRPAVDPAALDRDLAEPTGVVETGVFVGLATQVVVGHADGRVEERSRSAARG